MGIPKFYPDTEEFRKSFNDYFDNTPDGTVNKVGDISITKNRNGTATLTNGKETYNITKNTDPNAIAVWAPAIKAAWDEKFGESMAYPANKPIPQGILYHGMISHMPNKPRPETPEDRFDINRTYHGKLQF